MKTLILCLYIFCISLIFASGTLLAEEEAIADKTVETASTTPVFAPVLIISLADDNPVNNDFYNAGDKGKLFLSFDLYASSSEDLYINELKLAVVNSISSTFQNPHIKGNNIENIFIADGLAGNIIGDLSVIDASEGVRTFTDLNIAIPGRRSKRIYIYADIVKAIEKEVSSLVVLAEPAGIRAVGLESGQIAAVSGTAVGAWINLRANKAKADLIVTSAHIRTNEEHNNLIAGEPVYINILYKNIGNAPVREDFSKKFNFGGEDIFEFGNSGRPISTSSGYIISAGELLGSEEYAEIFVGMFKEAGEYSISIELDPENEIVEIDDWNNIFTKNISVYSELNYPDFIVYNIKVDPASPLAREDVRIDVVYKNIGSEYARDKFPTMTYFGQAEGWFYFDEFKPMLKSRAYPSAIEPLKTGETLTETYWGMFGRDREIELEAAVDPFGQVEEANENNNRFRKKIVIRKKEAVVPGRGLSAKLKGRIILKVEENGEAYYINPDNASVHFLGRPRDAFRVMREQGVGIKTTDLALIPVAGGNVAGVDSDSDGLSDSLEDAIRTNPDLADTDGDGLSDAEELERGSDPIDGNNLDIVIDNSFANKHKGRIFLQIEQNGEAWYVNPLDGKRYFLGRPADAFNVMRNLGLGISNYNFGKL